MKLNSSILLAVLATIALGLLVFRANGGKPTAHNNPATSENPDPVIPTAGDLAPIAKVEKSEAKWKTELTPEQFAVTRRKSTERAFSSPVLKEHGKGVFRCVACGEPLFASDAKFESGTGWPSFYKPFIAENVRTEKDRTLWMEREEVLCGRCGAHLGHVFDDGPPPTGQRYCLNGVALKFEPRP